jgi:sugar lactone lactonase YvrE
MLEIERLLDYRAIIGESPTWFAPEQALYWTDVRAPILHRLSATACRRSGASTPISATSRWWRALQER